VTVLEAIQRSSAFLSRKGVDSPRLQTELLLAQLLRLPRMQLYLNFERELTPPEVDGLRELVKRRGGREPLQHILGTTSFCGLEIAVNPQVLVPRPETELLAERGWTFLNQLSTLNSQPSTALDFGTGSGCLAIALASNCRAARVEATDSSLEALAVARENAARHGLTDRIEFRHGDGFAAVAAGTQFDLVISNPPYIPTADIAGLQPEVRDYDPRCALDGGPEGLDYYQRLAAESAAFLKPSGRLMVELGDGQAERVSAILATQKWIVETIQEDYAHQPRILVARRDGSLPRARVESMAD
jgi:release factor glutamine methyltransferase